MNPAHLTPRLARRQKLILGRMGVVTPPPDLALSLDEPAQSPLKPEQPGSGEPDKAAAVKPVSAVVAGKPIK